MAKKSLSLWARERLSKTLWSSPWKEKTRWFEEFHSHRKYPLNAVMVIYDVKKWLKEVNFHI